MLLNYARRSQVLAFSPLLYRYRTDNFPLQEELPHHDGSLEHILSLKPDLVISGEFNAPVLRQRLTQLGIKVVVFVRGKTVMDEKVGDVCRVTPLEA